MGELLANAMATVTAHNQQVRELEAAVRSYEKKLASLKEQAENLAAALRDYGEHDIHCLRGQVNIARPCGDGFERRYGYGDDAKWYPKGDGPECTCGFGMTLKAWEDHNG